jgi:2-oxo-4-hydroxy-4-carboxy-5-ureidoimidazoline decarboxylase
MTYNISELNDMNRSQFTDVLGSIFEQTPSIAFESWNHRPFKDFDALYQSMVDMLWQMPLEQQLALIRSHPDLGSRLKMAEFSVQEQAGVGLDRLSPEQFERFQDFNQQYHDRFDFPFIIAVKNHTQDSILQAFTDRVDHSLDVEFKQALIEILEIAKFRLLEKLGGSPLAPLDKGGTGIVQDSKTSKNFLVPLTKGDLGGSLRINGDRLMTRIFELAKIGGLPNGGVCRLAFTKEDILARNQISHWMQDA